MAPWIQELIRHSPFCVLATSNANGNCDASPKGGMPGFVKVLKDKQLFIPDVAANDPDEKTEVLQGLLLDVEESYSHCPRALKFSKLWDVEEISKHIDKLPLPPNEPGI
jgi:predicted pyridoxine 5'-phosphate oxidase superfamily flavin-nucleotide-binding protein